MIRIAALLTIIIGILTPTWAAAHLGQVDHVEGNALVLRSGEFSWRSAATGLPVIQGDRFIVHPRSLLAISLKQGGRLELGPHSDLIVEQPAPNGFQVRLLLGGVVMEGGPAGYAVFTASAAVYGAGNGTAQISVDEWGQTAVRVTQGVARVAYQGSTLTLQAGDSFVGGGSQSEFAAVSDFTPQGAGQSLAGPYPAGKGSESGSENDFQPRQQSYISTFGIFALPFSAFWFSHPVGHHHCAFGPHPHFHGHHAPAPHFGMRSLGFGNLRSRLLLARQIGPRGLLVSCDPQPRGVPGGSIVPSSRLAAPFISSFEGTSNQSSRSPAAVFRTPVQPQTNPSSRIDQMRQGMRSSFSNFRSTMMRRSGR